MEIRQIFAEMNQKLELINKKLVKKELKQDDAEEELEKLKHQSEEIVEEWLKFEEKLGTLLHDKMKPEEEEGETGQEETYHLSAQKLNQVSSSKQLNESAALLWNKGKALFDLMMMPESIQIFEQLIEKEPEFEPVKLYLANAYIANGQLDKARYYLHFLVETTENQDMLHLTLHALGCMEGINKEYDRSHYFFQKIELEDVQADWKPVILYNHSLSLFHLQKYEECLDKLIEYYQLEPDDWQAPYLLGKVFHQIGDEESGLAFWFDALQLNEHPHLLKTMAAQFELKGYYQMAAHCYERAIKMVKVSKDEELWFGWAWNTCMSQQYQKGKTIFIQALSLFPDHLTMQISYIWFLLISNHRQEGQKKLALLKQRHIDHPLIQGLDYMYNEKYGEALQYLQREYRLSKQ